MARMWDMDDMATVTMLAEIFFTKRSTIVNWSRRFADFPAPLVTLGNAPIYSIVQVEAWEAGRVWQHGRH